MRYAVALVVLGLGAWVAPALGESSLTKWNNDATLRSPHIGRALHFGGRARRHRAERHRRNRSDGKPTGEAQPF